MAYYDAIAIRWHQATGYQGGAFKKYILNDFLLAQIEDLQDKTVLELGAGNGYFMAMAASHFSGQIPSRLVISEFSRSLLSIAENNFRLSFAEYLQLDARGPFQFLNETFDLVVATMVFNELTDSAARRSLAEIFRVMKANGVLLLTVTHPDFIHNLERRHALKRDRQGLWTMPGSQDLRLPIVRRTRVKYEKLLAGAGFHYLAYDLFADERVLREKPGLKAASATPIALVFRCRKQFNDIE